MSQESISDAILAELARAASNFKNAQYRGGSYLPYYKESTGLEVKRILDLVARTGRTWEVPIGEFTLSTIRQKWYQGLNWLLENADPEKRYADINSRLDVRAYSRRGLVIRPKAEAGILAAYAEDDKWKEEFLSFVQDSEPRQKFERYGIPITPEDILWINNLLAPIASRFVWSVDIKGFSVVRYDN